MATYTAGVALAFDYEALNGTSGSFSPSGDDLALITFISSLNFGGAPNITDCKYGGSGGTSLTEVGTDYSWYSGNGRLVSYEAAPGPSGSTTSFGEWDSNPLQSAIASLSYSGVDPTTPVEGATDNSGSSGGVTTTVASVTVTGCTVGQTIIACVTANSDGVNLAAFSAVSGTTLRHSDVTGTFLGIAVLEKVATGSSETLEVNVNCSSSATLTWAARGLRVNDVAGGGPTYTLAADGGTYSLSGTSNVLTAGRAIGAEAGSFSLSGTAVTLTAARVLVADGGTYSLTGQDATLTYTPVSSYELVADGGTFTYSCTDAALTIARVLAAEGGAFSYAGQDATLTYSGALPLFIYDGHDGGKEPKKKQPDFKEYKAAKARLRKQIEAAFTSLTSLGSSEVKAEAEKVLAQVVSKQDISAALETIKLLESALESAQDEEDLLNILL